MHTGSSIIITGCQSLTVFVLFLLLLSLFHNYSDSIEHYYYCYYGSVVQLFNFSILMFHKWFTLLSVDDIDEEFNSLWNFSIFPKIVLSPEAEMFNQFDTSWLQVNKLYVIYNFDGL